MQEFLTKLGLTGLLSIILYYGVQVFGYTMHYGIAFLISLVVVFGGWLILDSDWID